MEQTDLKKYCHKNFDFYNRFYSLENSNVCTFCYKSFSSHVNCVGKGVFKAHITSYISNGHTEARDAENSRQSTLTLLLSF